MLEILVRDDCVTPVGKLPTAGFCYVKMRPCAETCTLKHFPNGVTQVSVCLFESLEQIMSAVGEELRAEERAELRKIWGDDTFPRSFERQEDYLLIRGDSHEVSLS